MEIMFDFIDNDYCDSLKRRFIELGKYDSLYDFNPDFIHNRIILSDKEKYLDYKNAVCLFDDIKHELSKYSRISNIYSFVEDRYKDFFNYTNTTKNESMIYSFFSFFGGSGVTSISLTFARNLLLNGKNVIYITSDSSYFDYQDNNSSKRLEYDLFKKENFSLRKFIKKDSFLLSYLIMDNFDSINELLNNIVDFDSIVIDFGKMKNRVLGDFVFEIEDYEDMRINNKDNEYIKIINRVTEKIENANDYLIPFDKKSFVEAGTYTDISISDSFSKNILKIINYIEYGKIQRTY